jgi:hypothetical protein
MFYLKGFLFFILFFVWASFSSIAYSLHFELQVRADTLNAQNFALTLKLEEIHRDVNLLRSEVANLQNETYRRTNDRLETALDRLAALDERIISLDNRVARMYSDVGGFGSNFTIAIAIMVCIAFITIVLVWIQKKKHIDPVNIQLARFEAELQKIDADKSKRIQKAMQELGNSDPLVAQLLKKYKLD